MAAELASLPLFTPVYARGADAWAGMAFVGATQVVFETQVVELHHRSPLNAQDHLQVRTWQLTPRFLLSWRC